MVIVTRMSRMGKARSDGSAGRRRHSRDTACRQSGSDEENDIGGFCGLVMGLRKWGRTNLGGRDGDVEF